MKEEVTSLGNQMPHEEGFDHSFNFLREGYEFILNRKTKLQSNIFETKILGKNVICLVGEEAAQLFYDTDKFERGGVATKGILTTLFGENSVQVIDGEKHRNRKKMLMSVMTPNEINRMVEITKTQWELSIDRWSKAGKIVFYEEMKQLFCEAAFRWIGCPLQEQDAKKITKELASIFDTPIKFGAVSWITKNYQNKLEKTFEQYVQNTRDEKVKFPNDSVFHQFSFHKDEEGQLLDKRIVANEIINLLRPIVGIAIYMNFIVLALHEFQGEKEKINNHPDYAKMFIQEVRRFYPFMPFAAATVKQDFTWNGYQFTAGTLTLLDIYGTNHDPNVWENPNEFNPERFANWQGSPFSFIPQGGGDYFLGHRCAGEHMTLELMKVGLDYLVNKIEYNVPEQDLSLDLSDIPSMPKSKIILDNVRRKAENIQ